jgi:hypothetical protein
LRILVDSTGYALQFDLAGNAVSNPPPKAKWAWAWPLFATWRFLGRRAVLKLDEMGVPSVHQRHFGVRVTVNGIKLASTRVLVEPAIDFIEDDILEAPASSKTYHVVRAANLLNRDYFDEASLSRIVVNLRQRMKPNGILAICSTANDIDTCVTGFRETKSPANHGTLYILRGESLEVIDRLGDGSSLEQLVLTTNPSRRV